MSHIISDIRRIRLLFLCLCFGILILIVTTLSGCSNQKKQATQTDAPLRDHTPTVLAPKDPDSDILDTSNAASGYIHLTYHGSNEKVQFQIQAPNEVTYTYLVTEYDKPVVYPLTGGNGDYLFSLLESVDVDKNLYAIVFSQTVTVTLENEFLPYLTPNVYVWFDKDSLAVKEGMNLAKNCHSDLEVISNIYNYVITNISYDTKKASSVTYGYIPDPDETLQSQTGICFDYASLMTSMLRSQRIPTKLEVGYAGEVYHAWISCYVEEIGWVDRIIEFDGKNWSLMDPTLAANNDSKSVGKYIGDGSNYTVKYTY